MTQASESLPIAIKDSVANRLHPDIADHFYQIYGQKLEEVEGEWRHYLESLHDMKPAGGLAQ